MKPDEDNCWYHGRHDLCKELYPGRYEWCSSEYHRCVECLDDAHCPAYKPYCDWDLECEECLVKAHCPPGQDCMLTDGKWKCRVKDCVDLIEEGLPDYCKDRFPNTPICDVENRVCVECLGPEDCEGERICINRVCVERGDRDCMDLKDAGITNYCSKNFPQRPVCHLFLRECVECQFTPDCRDGYVCANTKCIPEEWECEGPEDCMSDRFKCVKHKCVKKICSDYDDPDAFCNEYRTGWRCFEGECVRCIDPEDCQGEKKCMNHKCVDKTCDEYKQPDIWCQLKYGEDYRCVNHECVDTKPDLRKCNDFLTTKEADEFCKEQDPARPHCYFREGECYECNLEQHCPPGWICWNHKCRECLNHEDCDKTYKCTFDPNWTCVRRTCSEMEYCSPDSWCRMTYGEGYTCGPEDECVISDCAGDDSRCPENFYCPDDECVEGCRNSDNCAETTPWCSKLTGECEECLNYKHCDPGYECKSNKCVKVEDCMRNDKNCDLNWFCNFDHCEEGCRDNENCSEWTPHCSQKTAHCEECVYTTHCDPGYECKDYRCVWKGYDCSDDPDCPANWMCHDVRFECVFGCKDNDNCSKETPYCSQATGKCEECWSSIHCEIWQECDESYKCVARSGMQECKEGDKKSGYRCREGVWIRLDCHGPEECLGHEDCVEGVCIEREHSCEYNEECPSGYYCDVDRSRECREQRCRGHEDCPPGTGCDINAFGYKVRDNAETSCISWREYHCSDKDPCPFPWICDAFGMCIEALCYPGRECPDGFDCIDSVCIEWTCETSPNLDFCREKRGWYYRCHDSECILLACSAYADPDMMCMDTKGETYRCEEGRCMDLGPNAAGDPNHYCEDVLGVLGAYWNYDRERCEVPDCNSVEDPDRLCSEVKDERYKCREDVNGWACRRGRQGEECEREGECMLGLRCKEGTCIMRECINWYDCDQETEWCDHNVCVPLNKTCIDDTECREDYHCDPTGHCISDTCDTHYECNIGYCCSDSGECIPCEEHTCFGNFDCRSGWRCDLKLSKCTKGGCKRGSDCDPGYYCNLDTGECEELSEAGECYDNSECPEGQVCKGAKGMKWVQGKIGEGFLGARFGHIEGKRAGICVYPSEKVIAISGIDDEKTCDYCRYMWTKVGREGELALPPYHEHCRCRGTEEWE